MQLFTYFHHLRQLFTSIPYYTTVIHQSWMKTLSFFLLSCVLLGWATSARVILIDLPQIEQRGHQALTEFANYFPDDLKVSWADHVLTVDPAPQTVYFPSFIKPDQYQLPQTMAYFIASEQEPTELAKNLPGTTLLIVTPSQLHVNNQQQEWTSFSLQEVIDWPDFSLSKTDVPTYLDLGHRVISGQIKLVKIASPAILPIFVTLSLGMTSFLYAWLVYFVFWLNSFKPQFAQAWKFALNCCVVAQATQLAAEWINPTLPISIFSWTFWLILMVVVFSQHATLAHTKRES